MYVYKIINKINNKSYIGITTNIEDRFAYHKTRYNKTTKKEYNNKVLYRAFRKYGIDNFIFIILYTDLTIEDAKNKEIELIKKFNSLSHENGYNVTAGGDYRSNYGINNNTSKLTENEVINIRMLISNGEIVKSVYEIYKDKISYSAFQSVYSGRNWKHLGKPKTILPSGASISKKMVLHIRKLHEYNGLNAHEISKMLGIEYKKCWRICKYETYKNI